MKLRRILAGAALVCGSALVALSANATELMFTISNGGTKLESFDLNTLAGQADSIGGYIFFSVTNDSAGNNAAYFGDTSRGGDFGTGLLNTANNPCCGSVVPNLFEDRVSPPFYSDVGTVLDATAGESLTTSGGNLVQISAAPEPATWAMLLLGLFGVGAMMRGLRRKDALAAA